MRLIWLERPGMELTLRTSQWLYTQKVCLNSVLATVCQLGRLTLLHNRTLTTTMHVHTSFLINHKSLWVYLRADDVILLKSETVSYTYCEVVQFAGVPLALSGDCGLSFASAECWRENTLFHDFIASSAPSD